MSYNKILKNNNLFVILILLLSLSLFIGFYFNEDSTGGAYEDYLVHDQISTKFAIDFLETFLNFDELKTRHSPIIPIYFSIYKYFDFSDNLVRLLHVPTAFLIILIFYKCLLIKFKFLNKKIIYLTSFILILSPTVRSLAIWPDSHLYGILFFLISVYFFLKFENCNKNKKLFYAILNVIFLAISCYVRPSFALFVFYFTWFFFKEFKFSKNFFLIILINFLLSLPALYYLFYLKIMFLTSHAVGNVEAFTRFNPSNKILIISTIIFFHILPFIYLKFNFFKKKFLQLKLKEFLLTFLILLVCIYYFNYEKSFTGGGIFFHISNIFNSNLIFFIISYFCLLTIYILIKLNFNNFLLFIIIFLSNPQLTIYHKYYDPLILILFFLLYKISIDKKFNNTKYISFFYIHSFLFLLSSFLK